MSIIDVVLAAPSAYISYQIYKDRKIADMYLKTGMKDVEKMQECTVTKPSRMNYVGTMIPGYRWVVYYTTVRKEKRTLDGIVEVMNEKLECKNCLIVSAYWMYNEKQDNAARCPQCREMATVKIAEGEDEQYPFFKRKNKKEIIEMLEKKASGAKKEEKNKKERTKEEQIELYKKLQEKKKEEVLVSNIK